MISVCFLSYVKGDYVQIMEIKYKSKEVVLKCDLHKDNLHGQLRLTASLLFIFLIVIIA